MDNYTEKKKRGRKKKTEVIEPDSFNITVQSANNINSENIQMELYTAPQDGGDIDEPIETDDVIAVGAKKRGRKPKGGKLVVKQQETVVPHKVVANVILHLKCSLNDLHEYNDKLNKLVTDPMSYNPNIPPAIMTYNEDKTNFSKYDPNSDDAQKIKGSSSYAYENNFAANSVCSVCMAKPSESRQNDYIEEDTSNMKEINMKLKKLKINLYKNNLGDKKSACFWCTYEFDNHPCYIPKYEMDSTVFGYGSFCRPECAVAFLMKENIDDSTKFERYHLLNQIYSKVYDYKKNIKPAPNPFYLLEKYYGNMTIQEYRKMLKTEHMLLVIDKPLTRILPELHEDNEDIVLNIYGGSKSTSTVNNGVYKVKRQSEKQQGPSKSTIMRDKFGLSAVRE
uniref:MYM-type domain-containing protein n=1 Tax=viral metagenome TaxID=1070528 RepID=A0A6C0HHV4_9ZZZZ